MEDILEKLYITGYQSYELGVFSEKDPRVQTIKKILRNEIINYIENGLTWVIITGALGVELWAGQITLELKKEYPELRLAIFFPFRGFGGNWNENNQHLLSELTQQADFVDSVSHSIYKNPRQFKNHVSFVLAHTDASLVVYDREYPGKSRYYLAEVEKYQENHSYALRLISMDDLENFHNFEGSV